MDTMCVHKENVFKVTYNFISSPYVPRCEVDILVAHSFYIEA